MMLADDHADDGIRVLPGPTLLEGLTWFYANMPKVAREWRPKTVDALDFESRCDDLAEDRKFEREYGTTGPDADHAADVDWDRRQAANDRAMERP